MNVGVTKTPLGQVALVEVDGAITELRWGGENEGFRSDILKDGLRQIEEYFKGDREGFDLPLQPEGSLFQQLVYRQMLGIQFGHTKTYGEVAQALDANPQAVGQAAGSNPIPIIIPCHRILGAESLGGYSGKGGVESKVWLLRHEGAAGLLL